MSEKEINQRELLEEALDHLDQADSEVSSASSEAGDARRNADNAAGFASTAFDDADRAEDAADRARSELNSAVDLLNELKDLITQNDTDGEKSLEADIVRYKKRILNAHRSGHSPAGIAGVLEISEFLVQTVLQRYAETEAA